MYSTLCSYITVKQRKVCVCVRERDVEKDGEREGKKEKEPWSLFFFSLFLSFQN
jgi:hypothetical protein